MGRNGHVLTEFGSRLDDVLVLDSNECSRRRCQCNLDSDHEVGHTEMLNFVRTVHLWAAKSRIIARLGRGDVHNVVNH